MLRASALLVLAAILFSVSLGLSWGSKTVVHEDCKLDEQTRVHCTTLKIDAFYDPTVLRGRITWSSSLDGEAAEGSVEPFRHSYDGASEAWWESPSLVAARPLIIAAAAAAPATAALSLALQGQVRLRRFLPWPPLASASLTFAAGAASLGGMALHAAYWSADRAEPFQRMPGTWVLIAAGTLGIAGALRMHVLLRDVAAGTNHESPLVPAAALFGFDAPEEATPDSGAATEQEPGSGAKPAPPSKRWRPDHATVLALLALVLLLAPVGLPLAHKEITIDRCENLPGRGAVCTQQTLHVHYFAGQVLIDGGSKSSQALSYFGPFQERYGGPTWMGVGLPLTLAGALVMLAGIGQSLRSDSRESSVQTDNHMPGSTPRADRRLLLLASMILAAGTLVTLLAVVWQAAHWVGSPAEHSRPGLGLWAAMLGLLFLGGATGIPASKSKVPATARATSDAD